MSNLESVLLPKLNISYKIVMEEKQMMVRLIASDLDGTLLQNGNRTVSDKVIELAKILKDRGVIFVAASGRQYGNLKRLFKDIAEDMAYICENGALVKYKERTIFRSIISNELAREIMDDMYGLEGCEFLTSGENTSYIKPKDSEYKNHIENHVGNNTQVIDNYDQIGEDIIKISVYCKEGIDKYAEHFHNKWGEKMKVTVSGRCWLDIVNIDVNKGKALELLMKEFGVEYEETMSFGDSYNDIEMFETSYYSYAMSHSDSYIRSKARFITPNVESILFDVHMMYLWEK